MDEDIRHGNVDQQPIMQDDSAGIFLDREYSLSCLDVDLCYGNICPLIMEYHPLGYASIEIHVVPVQPLDDNLT